MPLGDSITHGYASTDDGGYRSQLFKLIVAANQKVTFTGSLMNGPTQVSGQTFPRTHEGHDGWTIDPGYSTYGSGGISSLVPSPAFDGKPNIVLLHIGTNDTGVQGLGQHVDAARGAARQDRAGFAQLAHRARADHAARVHEHGADRLQRQDPGIVQAHAAKGQHIIGVDMSKMPVPADIGSDSVHPNDQGYTYMAGVWYAAIKNLLPK